MSKHFPRHSSNFQSKPQQSLFDTTEEYLLLKLFAMKKNCVLFALMTVGTVLTLFVSPLRTHGQSEAQGNQIDLLLQEVGQQQITIANNQAIIDEKLAAIDENLRVARIFVSRAGGSK